MARLKLDENMPDSVGDILRSAGHDVTLARDQALGGADDDRLLSRAASEERALVTFDLHFSDIRRHPPGSFAGIVVLRLRDHSSRFVARRRPWGRSLDANRWWDGCGSLTSIAFGFGLQARTPPRRDWIG